MSKSRNKTKKQSKPIINQNKVIVGGITGPACPSGPPGVSGPVGMTGATGPVGFSGSQGCGVSGGYYSYKPNPKYTFNGYEVSRYLLDDFYRNIKRFKLNDNQIINCAINEKLICEAFYEEMQQDHQSITEARVLKLLALGK